MAAGRLLRTIMRQLVGLALEAERRALDLLVVLELELEQLDHLHGRAGGAGDGDAASSGRPGTTFSIVRWLIRLPRRGPPVAGHDHAVGVAHGDARWCAWVMVSGVGAATSAVAGGRALSRAAARRSSGPGSSPGVKNGSVTTACDRGLLAALLDVRLHEVLGVGLEHLVDLVEQVVELGLELLARSLRSPGRSSTTSSARAAGPASASASRSAMSTPSLPAS